MARYSSRLLLHHSANREILHSDSENAPNPKLLLLLLLLLERPLTPPWIHPPSRRRCGERRARTAGDDVVVVVEGDGVALVDAVVEGGDAEAAAAGPRVDDIADKTLEGRRRQEPVWKRKRRRRWN